MAKRERPPRILTVSRFTCIDHAEVVFRNLTLITGPQGSGKSVLCKLLYFCQRPFVEFYSSADEGFSVAQFRERMADEFLEWFPPSAWGNSKFAISFTCGGLEVKIKRSSGRGGVKDRVYLDFSEEFEKSYTEYATVARQQRQSVSDKRGIFYPGYSYALQRTFRKQLGLRFGFAYPSTQLYIPAGRAFFTTVGKAVAAFEHSRMFDPVTAAFGKVYIAIREQFSFYQLYTAQKRRKMERVFGGTLKNVKDELFVQTDDGRTVPLNALSSGQQELLPMWLVMDQFDRSSQWSDPPEAAAILYIEEPEAHLFPDAQAIVLEVLAEMVKRKGSRCQIVVTTHSPYILAKANNLMKAGNIGFRKRAPRQKAVSDVVPKELWLVDDDVAAYAIRAGNAESIVSEEKQISANYIDKISEKILDEYELLLDVVYGSGDAKVQ